MGKDYGAINKIDVPLLAEWGNPLNLRGNERYAYDTTDKATGYLWKHPAILFQSSPDKSDHGAGRR